MAKRAGAIRVSLCVAAPWIASCGAGTVGALAGGGGSSNDAATISSFAVEGPKVSPCILRFVLADAEHDPAVVEVVYEVGAGPTRALEQLRAGMPSNPGSLETTEQGIVHRLEWAFADEVDLPDDGGYAASVRVWARIDGGAQELAPAANGLELGLGNDAPAVEVEWPGDEVDGVVPIRFELSDSSSDVVRVRVEFDVLGDEPDLGWQLARPAGLTEGEDTPPWAFDNLVAPEAGTQLVFFWATELDLAQLERDVRVRFVAADPVVESEPATTAPFRVDNNAAPIARILEGPLLQNPDGLRGVPIPFEVIDEEADRVRVVFQWRRFGESFPALPSDPGAIEALLADPELRREHRICSEYAHPLRGRVASQDGLELVLPELAGSAAQLVATGLEAGEVELLRASQAPLAVAESWHSNPLHLPCAALPLARGRRALVLDEPSPSTWRLVEIELANGALVHEIASGTGAPSALAAEALGDSVLVASEESGTWRLARVELESGAVSALAAGDDSTEAGAIRGLASLGSSAAAITVASSLVRVEFFPGLPARAVTLLSELATPGGLVVDPAHAERLYVAERDGAGSGETLGRVLVLDLLTGAVEPLAVMPTAPGFDAFPHPIALALERGGARLLALCETGRPSAPVELRGVDFGGADSYRAFVIGAPLEAEAASLASAEGALLVAMRTEPGDLLVGGGIEQDRPIAAYDPALRRVELALPLDPVASIGAPWSIGRASDRALGSASGSSSAFVWDARDAFGGGELFLRATPMDADVGVAGASTGTKLVRHAFEGEAIALGGSGLAAEVVAVDIDADGDLDLVAPIYDEHVVEVFRQSSPGAFDPAPIVLGGSGLTDGPLVAAPADVEGDGDLDLVTANFDANSITLFRQVAPGSFDPEPSEIASAPVIDGPGYLSVADVDGDGLVDVASTNYHRGTLTVFWGATRGFDPLPLELGSPAQTSLPRSIRAADIDGDGDLDLAASSEDGHTLAVFWQESARNFARRPTILGDPETLDSPIALTVADVDRDGDQDLVSASYGVTDGGLALFLQLEPGVFDPTALRIGSLASSGEWIRTIEVADVDGDGAPDLVSADTDGPIRVHRQLAPASFDPNPMRIGSDDRRPFGVDVADLDGDGRADVIGAYEGLAGGAPSIGCALQLAPGVYAAAPTTLQHPLVTAPRSIELADLDRDGDLDVATTNIGPHSPTVFWQIAPGAFDATPTLVDTPGEPLLPSGLGATDVDGDGLVDLHFVATFPSVSNLRVHWQLAPGEFAADPLELGGPALTGSPSGMVAADVDGDGDLDLASANSASHTLTVFPQLAPRAFDAQPIVIGGPGVLSSPNAIEAADLEADGDVDLVASSPGNSRLVVFRQVAPGAFEPVLPHLTVSASRSIAIADVDQDGRLDLVSANGGTARLTVFWQDESGGFGSVPTVIATSATTPALFSLALVDSDLDGDVDVAAIGGAASESVLPVFEQLSPRRFDPVPVIVAAGPAIHSAQALAAADVDGDGETDFAACSTQAPTTLFWGGR